MLEFNIPTGPIDRLIDLWAKAPDLVDVEVEAVIRKTTLVAEREVVRRTPTNKARAGGRLRNAINSHCQGSGRRTVGIVEVANVPYALWVEEDTRAHEIKARQAKALAFTPIAGFQKIYRDKTTGKTRLTPFAGAAVERGRGHVPVERCADHILRKREMHRPPAARQGGADGVANLIFRLGPGEDHGACLGNGVEDGNRIHPALRGVLEGPFAIVGGGDLSSEDQDRGVVGKRGGDPGNEIGRSRPRGGKAGAEPAPDPGVSVGHEGCAPLVLGHHGFDPGIAVKGDEEVIERRAADAEDILDALIHQILKDEVRYRHGMLS